MWQDEGVGQLVVYSCNGNKRVVFNKPPKYKQLVAAKNYLHDVK